MPGIVAGIRFVLLVVLPHLSCRGGFPENCHCSQAATWHATRDESCTLVLFTAASSLFACTSLRSGQRVIPSSLSLQRRWFLRCLGSAWARIVVLMVLVHLLRRDGNPRTHLIVFRAPRDTLLVMISPMVQLPPAPLVLACTSVWSGLRTISSLSRWTAVPAAAIVSPMCPGPTNCSAWRWQFIDKAFLS